MITVISKRIKLRGTASEVFDLAYERGWTDGLPIIPPTQDKVGEMVEAVGRDPQEIIAAIPPAFGKATVEKLAINAVMAGCLPAYFPVILTAVEAMVEPNFFLYGSQVTTNPVAIGLLLNGPIRKELDVNCGHGCLGPGWRANATLGRAIRLILLNLGEARPGLFSRASFGTPGKYTLCFGESEETSPWEPLHVERGFKLDDSTVTVIAVSGFINISEFYAKTPEEILTMLAHSMTSVGSQNCAGWGGEPILCIGHDRAIKLGEVMTKAQVKQWLYEHAIAPVSNFCPAVLELRHGREGRIFDGKVRLVERPEDIMIVVAGGVGPQSMFLPTFNCRSVTKLMRR